MQIRILGGLAITSPAGDAIRLGTRKTALLLVALALAGDKGLRREALCATFWPDRGEAQARGSLRQALAALRRMFPDRPDAPIRIDGDLETVHLIAPAEEIDAWLFDRLVQKQDPAKLANAAELYQGDVLVGVALPEPLDQFVAPHQRAYRQRALQLVETLSQSAAPSCQALAERLLAGDPASEEAHRALIRLYLSQGRHTAAVQQFERCKEALRRELGVEPEAQTSALLDDHRSAPEKPKPSSPKPAAAPTPRDREQPSVIVMPFDNLSGEADEYFVDGVVEEITAALSRVRDFFVIARQSAFTYKGRFVDVREIGRELGVNYVVEGTVRRGGARLRISVQLIDAETGTQLWSERYEGATTDIFEFQDRIAGQVAGAIYPAVRNAEIDFARRKSPGSLRAYDLVLQAYPKIWSQVPADNAQAIAMLKSALAADPRYGRAHALLAWCHAQDVVYLWSDDPERSRQEALSAVETATGLIGDDPTALAAIGAAISQTLADLDRAATYIERALALDPNNAWAWARYAWVALYKDEPARARERFERALALSPLDPLEFNIRMGIAMSYGQAGDYAHAAKLVREVLNNHPHVTWAYRQLAYTAALAGDLTTARDAIKRLRAAHPNSSIAFMRRCHPSRHVPHVFDVMIKGWRLAGLPET